MQAEKPKNLQPVNERFSINRDRKLGEGCYGNVYEGFDHQMNRKIAIKHLNKPENFMDEISTLEKLSTLEHPNIMGFYGYKYDEKDVYLFVEYCPGGVLTDLIAKGLEEEEVLDMFRQLVEGMCYMNAKSKMHRDLKPDNILIGTKRDIKISDFGLSRENDGIDVTGVVGTPLYAGPEVYTNYTDSYGDNCDVWGAGLILFQMLTGKHVFDHIKTMSDLKSEWKLFERGEKRVTYPKQFHPQWEFITNLMLTHNFKKRPTFHEILQILKKVDDHGPMRKQILNKKEGKVQANLSPAESYLSYIDQKGDLLTGLFDILKQKSYPHAKDSLKYMLIFLAACRYITRVKKLIRGLKFKTLKYPNDKQVLNKSNPDPKVALVVENYRTIFEAKFTKTQNLVVEKIIPTIEQLNESPEQKALLKSLDCFKLVEEAKERNFDIQDTYLEEYLKLLSFHKMKPSDQKIKGMTFKDQAIYLQILLLGFLDTEFPDTEFMKRNFIGNKMNKIEQNEEEILRNIVRLKGFLK